jgi:NADPH-dependent glutamate synthase beta subunit-like oxidoreductase
VDGAEYLDRASRGAPPALGHRLVVVGGGSAALDVARSARRAGHAVTVLALETRAALPAQREEVVEALEEGIQLVDASMLRAATPVATGGVRFDCIQVHAERGPDGNPRVTPRPGTEFAFDADAVVTSIGQDPELAALGAGFTLDGALLRTDAHGTTSVDRVWAGGDLASNARFVSEAIGAGERAALAIDRRLRRDAGEAVEEPLANGAATVPLAAINLWEHPSRARAAERRLAVAERLADGAEVQLGLADADARAEAARCFSCGTCTHCDNCVTYCPDLAVQRTGDGYRVLGDYCKGCGVCVSQCPTGSMKMLEEMR